jgi:drug/metabolite transporter (DMT)-like permease
MRFVAWMVLVATLMLWSGNWIVARAGVTMHLMPAMGVALAALFLGEYPSWFHLCWHRADTGRGRALVSQSFIGRQYPVSSR